MHYKEQTIEERFSLFVNKHNGCWEWVGFVSPNGYGVFTFRGVRERAHRASWRIHFGGIPDGMYVCHKCDNRKCVNPQHLFIGSQSDNMVDAFQKGRIDTDKAVLAMHAAIKNRTVCRAGHSVVDADSIVVDRNGFRRCKLCRRMAMDRLNLWRRQKRLKIKQEVANDGI